MKSIVLITDFGTDSPYVAELKGAILTVNQNARIIDGTHAVPPQNLTHGAFVVEQLATAFPTGTIFVVVIDPGVGSTRDILLAEYQGRFFIAPDNGVLSYLTSDCKMRVLNTAEYFRAVVSATFHGRDIMGPVAAHLSNGVHSATLSRPLFGEPVCLNLARPQIKESCIAGEIVYVDGFGNLISNIKAEHLVNRSGAVEFADLRIPLVTTYADSPNGSAVALIGSKRRLEIAVVNGNAQKCFSAEIGDELRYRL